ncbi:acetolactate synthase 2 catalytic subunit [Catenovulum sp. 2E275]|uniref:acetolactate synthase 2 catalytic subunit n=1 Tax=Catenovulum sp. 2E275 TaxID=2980497 RepID=UPI0021CF17B0|nr:acetolactate synthase 2 catalytic subunit [Catenovulum sp. 2E275]MCU4675043.1 acetolactate synthase 2 catalytic subunit [Catenovulum sp. 2E275]
MTGAELVLKVLQQHGIKHIFGYPGGAIMPIYDALYDSDVEHFLCRHEQGAAFSAIGYARSTGKVGVCMATSGPGATNLVTGLADAMMDSVPVVAITGQVFSSLIGTDAFQEMDVLGMSLSITKQSFLVQSLDELADILHQAFEVAQSGRPGPVLVDIPKDIQVGSVDFEPYPIAQKQVPDFDAQVLADAQALIKAANKPLFYIGGGVGMADAIDEMQDLLAKTKIPAISTLKALGTVPADYPYNLGLVGMHGNQAANHAVQDCDLLICTGARFDDRVTGKLDTFAPNAKVIHLDIDPAEISKLRQADISILADFKKLLPELAVTTEISPWQQQVAELKTQYAWRYDYPGDSIYAPKLLNLLSQKLPFDHAVSCDVGQHQMWVAQHMLFSSPRNHLSSGGAGTMGFGLPAAIGVQVARPDCMSVVVSGDGSFMMNVQELGTIRRFKLPVKIVLLDNQRLGMVKQWQELFFEERYSETNLSDNPDFVTLAKAFDIPALTISQDDQIEDGINQLINTDGPFLLHVQIDDKENVWPLVPPGKANHDMLEGEKV